MSRSLEDILFGAPSPQARKITQVVSLIAAAGLIALAAGVVWRFHSAGQLEARFWEFFAWPTTWAFLAKGLLGTLASSAMAAVIALSLGLVLLAGRLARPRIVRWPSIAVIEFLRGTPTLLLIYVCFLVLPAAGIKLGTYWMLTLPIGLSTAAVVAEVYRAGVLAVPRGQTDAARSLGLTEVQVFRFVVFPQALRYIVPALVAQLVIVVKDTTFGYIVTYGELMQNAKVLIANYHALVPVYLVVAVLYCLVNYAISRASRRLSRPVH
ncbi:amino acid ABC transporter permease [Delftia sp. HK171]|jgi:His/Glu/Gln/Arg/opine family amino acid ABC transporter permease subunit|uniref:Amino acid ABC transporter permease n=1 Tax=Delftia acidovorans TaxID=80866 RepID=A0AAJ2R2N8_DELAC|nr:MULTISPECIES: amino acid ABC transporter permease [Delftia]PIF37094.1 amino acid ABC transporter membrane protein 2 (PAAT family) [Burkholderiales bacterium 23]AEF89443.1 polar amino acid ABC transporter, inner membrane subunit [Delftia sp. Cs1-4]APE49907.1 amino acid ABC transporter permease [Delftia sp. HK171]ATH16032.1 amino acid ABC transporter permease [Delftia acidovorans]KZK31737.1 amino acid ABC transporter permease [Delftia sp. GW456-R20]